MEFQVRYSALFLLFSVIDNFEWFWKESLHKNIQLMWEFLRAPFLVLHFSYYTLMTFLMMLSVILLSVVMILLSILSVIGHLICGNNLNWLLNLNLIYETWWTGVRSGLLISMVGKFSCYLDLLDKLQKQICRVVGPSLAASLEPSAHCQNVASLSLLYRYYFGRCFSELAQLVPLPFFRGRSTHYSNRLPDS